MLKLKKEKNDCINVLDMKDGDIAVIISWKYPSHEQEIVQRYDINLVSLGKSSGYSWPSIFDQSYLTKYPDCDFNNCTVRILNKGEVLVIE